MAAETVELDKDAFMRLVTEEHLQVEGPSGGYLYTGKRGRNGWELYKTANNPWYLYQATRVATDANAAGNPTKLDIAVNTGQIAKLVSCEITWSATGNHGLALVTRDEDNVLTGEWASSGALAAGNVTIPGIGANQTTTDLNGNSTGLLLGPGMKLSVEQTGASANANNTLTVALVLLLSTSTEPTWSHARSTDTANITLADSTISAENTMRLVAMP